jgi:hypothetical protein
MVKQMQGKYAVKSPVLRPLYEEARKLSRRIQSFEMRHTLRGGNKEADRLANEAMDKGMGKITPPRVGKPSDFAAARQQGSGAGRVSGVSGAGGVSHVSGSTTRSAARRQACSPGPRRLCKEWRRPPCGRRTPRRHLRQSHPRVNR